MNNKLSKSNDKVPKSIIKLKNRKGSKKGKKITIKIGRNAISTLYLKTQ